MTKTGAGTSNPVAGWEHATGKERDVDFQLQTKGDTAQVNVKGYKDGAQVGETFTATPGNGVNVSFPNVDKICCFAQSGDEFEVDFDTDAAGVWTLATWNAESSDATVFSQQLFVHLSMKVTVDDAADTATVKVYNNDNLRHTFTVTDDQELAVTVDSCNKVIIQSGSGTGVFEYALESLGPGGG